MKKYGLILCTFPFIILSCGGEEGAPHGLLVEFTDTTNIKIDPFNDVERTVKDLILDFSYPTPLIDLSKKVSFYITEGTKKAHFKDRIAETFEMSPQKKRKFTEKMFVDIKTGIELVDFIEDEVANKDSIEIVPDTISTAVDTNQIVML